MEYMIKRGGKRNIDTRANPARRGFTLLEFSIVFLLMGLATTALIQLAKQYSGHQDVVVNQERMEIVQKAIEKYTKDNGGLPCPAPRDLDISNQAYGKAINCGDGDAMAGTVSVNGVVANGGSGLVRIGAIPARTLGLADVYMENVWGKLFTYAVSEDLTDSYDPRKAAVNVVNPASGAPILTGPGPVAATYVIVNHGQNGTGAFTRNGSRPIPCNPGASYEDTNCDDDATFAVAPYSSAAGATSFQNKVSFATALDFVQYPTCAASQTLTSTDGLTFSCQDLSITPTLCPPNFAMTTIAGVITCLKTMNPPPDCADGEVLVADPNGIDFTCQAEPPPVTTTLPVCGAGRSLTSDGTTVSCAQLTLPAAPLVKPCTAGPIAGPGGGWYGCTATCPAGYYVTGGSMDEDIDDNRGMYTQQSGSHGLTSTNTPGNGWTCAYKPASCRSGIGTPAATNGCNLSCRALCSKIVIQ
jgi:type II secretory pathway pseudopilin PulG